MQAVSPCLRWAVRLNGSPGAAGPFSGITSDRKKALIGMAAALAVTLIWSIWLVVSRAAALSPLTPFDLAAIRYGVSGIVALPIVLAYQPWRGMALLRIITITLLLGPLYVLLAFGGFHFAPAAHGGIFMNGALPLITLAIAWLWLRQKPTGRQITASLIILTGVAMTVGDTTFDFAETWRGDALFVLAAVSFCFYVTLARLWEVTVPQVLMCSAVLNGIIYVPIWYFLLPSGFAEVSQSQFWLQFLFQGFAPNLFGLLMVAIAARNIGPSSTAAVMSGVPALVAFMSMIFLAEPVGPASWAGIIVLTAGILIMTRRGRVPVAPIA